MLSSSARCTLSASPSTSRASGARICSDEDRLFDQCAASRGIHHVVAVLNAHRSPGGVESAGGTCRDHPVTLRHVDSAHVDIYSTAVAQAAVGVVEYDRFRHCTGHTVEVEDFTAIPVPTATEAAHQHPCHRCAVDRTTRPTAWSDEIGQPQVQMPRSHQRQCTRVLGNDIRQRPHGAGVEWWTHFTAVLRQAPSPPESIGVAHRRQPQQPAHRRSADRRH
jgi:hypothetical protein